MIHAATLALAALSLSADDIVIERLFGPDTPGLPKYKHPAAICELDNGDLLLAFFCGSGEYAADTAVRLSRRKAGEKSWSAPRPVSDKVGVPEGNPVIWQAPDGVVWLFNVIRFGKTWSTSRIEARTSSDRGETWTKPVKLTEEAGTMVRGQPIVVEGGDYLLPIYHETGSDRESVGADTTSLFLRYDPKTKKWSESPRIRSRIGNLQPAVAVVEGNYLVAYCRRGGAYDGRPDGRVIRSESKDGGKTWSPGVDSSFPNPHAAVDFIRLSNGHLLLVYNDSVEDRSPLTVAISTDGDKSYPHRRDIATRRDGDYAYPYAIQSRDGSILIVYTSNHRQVVNLARFEESAILGHTKP